MSLDGNREAERSPLCWVTAGPHSCSRRGMKWVWWNDIHPRVLACTQHAKNYSPAPPQPPKKAP